MNITTEQETPIFSEKQTVLALCQTSEKHFFVLLRITAPKCNELTRNETKAHINFDCAESSASAPLSPK